MTPYQKIKVCRAWQTLSRYAHHQSGLSSASAVEQATLQAEMQQLSRLQEWVEEHLTQKRPCKKLLEEVMQSKDQFEEEVIEVGGHRGRCRGVDALGKLQHHLAGRGEEGLRLGLQRRRGRNARGGGAGGKCKGTMVA
jgi:hypothetical protein